mgnify:CR=1 FL=1
MRSLWLAKKTSRSVGLQFVVEKAKKKIDFEIIKLENRKWISETTNEEITKPNFEGTVKRGNTTCPVCGFTTKVSSVRRQLSERHGGTNDARLFGVVTTHEKEQGRFYRLPEVQDLEAVRNAKTKITKLISEYSSDLSLIPNEVFSITEPRRIPIPLYGLKCFGDLFAYRQSLALATLTKLIASIRNQTNAEIDLSFTKATISILAILLGRQSDSLSSLTRWQPSRETNSNTFGRQALPIVWDFVEPVPISESAGSIKNSLEWILSVINSLTPVKGNAQVERVSATKHILPDDICDAIITDPPYYFSVPYAELSDYFYVWLRRALREVHPDLFNFALTPKEDECIQNLPHSEVSHLQKDSKFYEDSMSLALSEARRIANPKAVSVVVFAHTETDAWEALLSALINSGWCITASWAIDTEMSSRMIAQRQSSLASSVHLVCRPRENSDGSLQTNTVGEWSKVLQELPRRIHEWMPRLRDEGIVGADAIFACLGPALEIFSRFERVEKSSGEVVPLRVYLESVWAAVSKEALKMIFAGADASGFEPDARLTAMWLWTLSTAQGNTDLESRVINALNPNEEADDDEEESTGKAKTAGFSLEFDTARKIAQGMGINLEELRGTVEVKGELARLLAVKERSNVLFGTTNETTDAKTATRKKNPQPNLFAEVEETIETGVGGWNFADESRKGETVLDRLHQAMLFFAANRSEALKRFLVEDGVGQDERFWRLANALSALYPTNSEEKRWVDGILARKKGLGF